jgi:hypothetical protein
MALAAGGKSTTINALNVVDAHQAWRKELGLQAIQKPDQDRDQDAPVSWPTTTKSRPSAMLPYWAYYTLLTAYDVMQGSLWRLIAPAIDDDVFKRQYKMVFVVGCGRSGTTILSRCLGRHRQIAELNEPAHLWIGTHAGMDILSPFARLLGGRLRLDSGDVTEPIKARYRAMLDFQMKRRSPIVCDKLPQNSFRADFLNAVCPDAKFVLIERSPRAVARSIERCVARDGTWWGFNDYKWRALVQYASTRPDLAELIPYAVDHYYRGLIEWRITQELAHADLARIESERQVRVSYEDFCARPEQVMSDLLTFCDVPHDPEAVAYATSTVVPSHDDEDETRHTSLDERLHARILGEDPNAQPSLQDEVA